MKIVLSGTLQRFTGYVREHDVEASHIDGALSELVRRHPGLRPVLFDGAAGLRDTNAVFLEGEQVMCSELRDPRPADSRVEILTAIAGG